MGIQCRDYGYALLRVDARGVGGSQGKLDPFGLERSVKIQADAEGQGIFLLTLSLQYCRMSYMLMLTSL